MSGGDGSPHDDPEGYFDAIGREVRLARTMEEPAVVTGWLVGANVVIWAAAVLYSWMVLTPRLGAGQSYLSYAQLSLYSGMNVDRLMVEGQWWRLMSSQFVHLDILHLAFNVYGLYVLGSTAERLYGRKRYVALFLVSGTAGAVVSFWFTDLPSGGASGALYGLIGTLAVVAVRYWGSLPERLTRVFGAGIVPWVVLSLGVGFLEIFPADNAGHLGGLAAGVLLGLALRTRLRERPSRAREWAISTVVFVGVCALVWAAAHWSDELTHCTESKERYLECYPEVTPLLRDADLEAPSGES